MSNAPRAIGSRPQPLGQERVLRRDLKERSLEAWARVYSAHHERLYRYVLFRLGSREEAEDLVGSVFLRGLAHIDSYKDDGKPIVAWLYGICQNLIREYRRKARRQELTIPEDAEAIALADSAEAVPDTVDLENALNKLTPAQQEVINLVHLAGFTVREAAEMLGKTQRSVYYLEARALKTLKQALTPAEHNEVSPK